MGDELTGSCEGSRGKVEISGKVEGPDVSWMYKSEYEGSPLTVRFKWKPESARANREFPTHFTNLF